MSEIKGYKVFKKINEPAKVIGLFYNTFFIFILFSFISFMLFTSLFGGIGFFIGAFFILIIYIALYYYQTKFGPKEIAKYMNAFIYLPMPFFKIKKSIKKMY